MGRETLSVILGIGLFCRLVLGEGETLTSSATLTERCEVATVAMAARAPRSIPPELSYDCYEGGRCTVFALANGMNEPVLKVGDDYAKFLRRTGEVPSVYSMGQYLKSKGLIKGEPEKFRAQNDVMRLQNDEALRETEGKFLYVLVYPNHVVSIYRGKVSNAAEFYEPGSALAAMGRREQSIEERQQYLKRNTGIFGPPQFVMRYRIQNP